MLPLSASNTVLDTVTVIRSAEVISFYNDIQGQSFLSVNEISKLQSPIKGVHIDRDQQVYTVPYDETIEVPLLNPLTGELLNSSITTPELITILYSIYAFARNHHLAAVAAQQQANQLGDQTNVINVDA